MTGRIVGILVVIVAILFLPYWLYIPLLFIAIIFYPFFWEGILLALLIEVLHGDNVGVIPSLLSPLALVSLFTVIILMPFRERLRSYV